ncbi:MAG: hypothetical protein U0Z75_05825 [Deinococcaceae bacterium]
MAELLYPDVFVGKSLEDVISSPSLWAKCIDMAIQEGDDSLYFLRIQLQNTPGPVARARECQVLLALNEVLQAARVIRGQDHPLCKAMHLAVKMSSATFSDHLYISELPEILTTDRSDLGLESQMRWAFRRAQSFKKIGNNVEALRLFYLTHHAAEVLQVHSIFRVCETQIQTLTPSSFQSKINLLSLQCREAQQANDIRARNHIICYLGVLHVLEDDYIALRKCALEHSTGIVQDHLMLVADFFSGDKPSVSLRFLGDCRYAPFCVTGYLLWKFKEYTYAFKDHTHFQDKLNPVLDLEIPEAVDFPILNFISWTVRSLAHLEAKDIEGAKHAFSQMQYFQGFTENMPKWSEHYMALIEALLAQKKTGKMELILTDGPLDALEKSPSFVNFTVECVPEVIFWLHHYQRTTITEKLMGKVLWFEPISEYLSEHPDIAKLPKNTTESDILKSKINILENRLEEAKNENDIRARDCSLYGLCVLSALNDDYPAFMEYAKGFTESALKDHMILFAKFFANENPGYQLPESFGPEDQPFYSLTRLLLTFKQYNWHYRNSHHNPEYDNMRNSILNWEIPETLDVPLTNLMALTLKILTYLMNWDVKTPKPLMQQMRDIMKTTKLTETERYYVWLAEGMLDYQTRQRMKPMYVAIIEKGIERQKSFQWFVVQTCPQILIYLEKHGKSKVVKKLAKDTLKRWAGPSGPRWA